MPFVTADEDPTTNLETPARLMLEPDCCVLVFHRRFGAASGASFFRAV